MSWWEWLDWRWMQRRARAKCRREGHEITGPTLALGGFMIYRCNRCSYRFRADKVIAQ